MRVDRLRERRIGGKGLKGGSILADTAVKGRFVVSGSCDCWLAMFNLDVFCVCLISRDMT